MPTSIREAVQKSCRHFMVPIARFLLKNGVSYREFAEISKLAFVQVASDEYGIRGRPTNMSRVAAMTGLTRKEVRKIRTKLRRQDWSLHADLSKPGAVLSHWYTDPAFSNKQGKPRLLAATGSGRSRTFADLVRIAGGDLPPGAMLKELERAGCVVEERPGVLRAVKREFAPRGTNPFVVERFGECVHDLAETMSHNMSQPADGDRRFEFRAWSDQVDPRHLPKLKQLIARRGRGLLQAVDDWLAAHKAPVTIRETSTRSGVGIYYFEGPSQA